MMSYYNKTLGILEFPTILNMLADQCVSDGARETALSLSPISGEREIENRLGETEAAVSLSVLKGAPSFFGIFDITQSLHRAEMGGVLSTGELLRVASLLQCARVTSTYLQDDKLQPTQIDYLFHALRGNRYLEDRIKDSILSEEEIADNASPELAAIRKKIRLESANIRASLQKIISSPTYAKYLQEPIVTMRSGRYVVPVKVEHKNEIQGLVHDVSASGMTVFVEPVGALKANNELKELEAKEKAEIDRILQKLSASCAEYAEEIQLNYRFLVKLDFIFAKSKLAYHMNGIRAGSNPELGIVLKKARHPLLDPAAVVPINIDLGDDFNTLVITGPNTGGKTVCLKTLGLFTVMNQCGLFVPAADGTNLPVFSSVLADIGDEQSIEQSLSTFSSHMKNIVCIMNECDDKSLVLFDELGAGTDPAEGAALAISVIETVRSKGALVAATTHYSELKVYAINTVGVQNASCEFDLNTLKPTYRILLGIPGKSNAFAISKRLGLDERVIDLASSRLNSRDVDFEETVSRLDEIRVSLEQEKEEIDRKLKLAEEHERKAALARAELEVRLEKADIKARRDAERIINEAKSVAESVFSELDEMKKQINDEIDAQTINRERNELRRKLNEAITVPSVSVETVLEKTLSRPVEVGDTVIIKAMNMKADVVSVSSDGSLQLRAGIIGVSAQPSEVVLIEDQNKSKRNKAPSAYHTELRAAAFSNELDLRGMESLEAVYVAEQYLDNAVMSKVKTVTIIHGKGTGALRAAIHQMLRRNKLVKSFRLGNFGEGESGVTVVELK